MAERLTECIDSHLLDNGEMVKEYSLNSKIKLNHFSCMDIPNAVYDKLGELEDIFEKYGIESLDILEQELKIAREIERLKNKEFDLSNSAIVDKDFYKDLTREIEKLETDRDIWKKACELACDAMTKLGGDDCCGCRLNKEMCKICENKKGLIDYFYQQAKKEGNDE